MLEVFEPPSLPPRMYSTLSMGMRLATTIASSASDFDFYTSHTHTHTHHSTSHDGVVQGRVEGREGALEAFRSFSESIQHPGP